MEAIVRLIPLRTRVGAPADYPSFVRLFHEIAPEDPAPDRERFETSLAAECLFAEQDGVVAGFTHTERYSDQAYVHLVAVAPDFRRRAVGRSLMEAVRTDLRSAGIVRWKLHVREANAAAIALYEAVGMSRAGVSVGMRIRFVDLEKLPASFDPLSVAVVDEDRDAEVERALGIDLGRLARARARGRVVLALFRSGAPVGIAVHHPLAASTFPMRVMKPDFVGALLKALEPHARQDKDYVELGLEDDAESERLLASVGGVVLHRALRYEGRV